MTGCPVTCPCQATTGPQKRKKTQRTEGDGTFGLKKTESQQTSEVVRHWWVWCQPPNATSPNEHSLIGVWKRTLGTMAGAGCGSGEIFKAWPRVGSLLSN